MPRKLPTDTLAAHLNADLDIIYDSLTIAGVDRTSAATWTAEIKRAEAASSALVSITTDATENGSVWAVGDTAVLHIDAAEINALGRGRYHLNVYYEYDGIKDLVEHIEMPVEG